MESKLEQLMNSTPFHELNKHDKEYVLNNITEVEYNQFREIITSSKVVFESEFMKIEPEKRIKENLSSAFKSKHNQSIFDKITALLTPLFRAPIYKPVLALGAITVMFYVVIPKETKRVKIAKIKNQTPTVAKEIIKRETKESDDKVESMNQPIKPIYKNIDASFSELSEEDFLAGTENPFKENEKTELNCEFGMLINDETFISIEEFVSYTTIQNQDVEGEQLIINPEDLK